jgi:hypothetical protein
MVVWVLVCGFFFVLGGYWGLLRETKKGKRTKGKRKGEKERERSNGYSGDLGWSRVASARRTCLKTKTTTTIRGEQNHEETIKPNSSTRELRAGFVLA